MASFGRGWPERETGTFIGVLISNQCTPASLMLRSLWKNKERRSSVPDPLVFLFPYLPSLSLSLFSSLLLAFRDFDLAGPRSPRERASLWLLPTESDSPWLVPTESLSLSLSLSLSESCRSFEASLAMTHASAWQKINCTPWYIIYKIHCTPWYVMHKIHCTP